MEITFEGHTAQTRTINPTPIDLLNFKSAIKQFAVDAIKYRTWEGPYHPSQEKQIIELCEKYGVDHTYAKDRVAFVSALIELI